MLESGVEVPSYRHPGITNGIWTLADTSDYRVPHRSGIKRDLRENVAARQTTEE